MANYREDIINIELKSGSIHRSFLNYSIGAGDENANRFGIKAFRDGTPENLTGTCIGLFVRADGETVPIDDGVISGNTAYVTLKKDCYAVEGNFTLAIKTTATGNVMTLRIVDGVVSRTSTDVIVDPGTIIPSVEDLIAAIEAAVESIPPDYSNLWATIAKPYDSTKKYFIGDYCTYSGDMYRCKTPIMTAENWTADHWVKAVVGEEIFDTGSSYGAAMNLLSTGKVPLPGVFIRNSYVANANAVPYFYNGTNRECNVKPITVDEETTFNIADGFRARRYWFDREDGTWMTFDGSWKTGSFILETDKLYFINIARVTEHENEVANIQHFVNQVYANIGNNEYQKFISLSANSAEYSYLLSNVTENVICFMGKVLQ